MKNLVGALAVLLLGATYFGAETAEAGTSFEFLFSSSNVTNDDQYLLHLAVGNYGYSRRDVEPMLPRLHAVEDDLPVVLFLAAESGRSLEFIVGLRSKSLAWSAIFSKVGVSYDRLFVGIDRDPGPPYGKAWGHWKKRSKGFKLSDGDIVGLVNVQTGRRVTGLSAFDIARARGQGKSVAVFVADKKGGPHRVEKNKKGAKHTKTSKPVRDERPKKRK